MRISFPSLIAVLLFLSSGISVGAQARVPNTFTADLSFGSSGAQVAALQKILNQDPDTRIASMGPGSPGNETSYFGLLTKAAVVRFQEKYATDILVPAGLMQASGYIGSYTRAKLNVLSILAVGTGANTPTTPPVTASQNPNLKNLDLYIGAIKEAGLKQGLPLSTLSFIEEKIRTEAATTTDFTQQFFNNQKTLYEKKISEETSRSPGLAFFEKVLSFVAEPFSAEKAYAGTGIPFGGYITYVNPAVCDCPPGLITQIFVALPNVTPLGASNLLLNYANGSEAFDYHNIPEPSIAVLGMYVPGAQACWTYVGVSCVVVPSKGLIINPTGSSLVP